MRYTRLTIAYLVLACTIVLVSASAFAQTASSPATSKQSADATSVELAKESREAAAEDEQAQFKHSWLVQLVAKQTGLSLDHAYWLCVLLNLQ
jgi:hypothetical protein